MARPSSSLRFTVPLLLLAGCSSGQVTATTPDPVDNRKTSGNLTPRPGQPVPLPAVLVEDRFYLEAMTQDGETLRFFTDTGGGLMLSREAAERIGMGLATIEGDEGPIEAGLLPSFAWDAYIPKLDVFDGRIPVVDAAEVKKIDPDIDGMLGQAWFKERVWTLDYGAGKMDWRAPGDIPEHKPENRAYLGFIKDAEGKRGANFPRIEVKIDGQPVDLLFDTGATVALTPKALAAMGDDRGPRRATSFISATTFEAWRTKHPEWRVIEEADASAGGEPMIEVPEVTVGGFTVGPVFFTRRADNNFHEFVSKWTDKKVDGALGGNALRFFRITLDYPRGFAIFEKAETPPPP